MVYALNENYGFFLLSGEVGTGKTTLIHYFLTKLPETLKPAVLSHTILSPKGLVKNICHGFGWASIIKSTDGFSDLFLKFREKLMEGFHARGERYLLVLDEAQNLKPPVLEQLRIISNIELEEKKCLPIFLVGQLPLEKMVASENMKQLNDRIVLRYRLQHLDRFETNEYINYRLRTAGAKEAIFTDEAISEIYSLSKGIPRRINVICENALVLGYVKSAKLITPDIIHKIAGSDFQDEADSISSLGREAKKKAVSPTSRNRLFERKEPRNTAPVRLISPEALKSVILEILEQTSLTKILGLNKVKIFVIGVLVFFAFFIAGLLGTFVANLLIMTGK